MKRQVKKWQKMTAYLLGLGLFAGHIQAKDLLNVSYDPTRELYKEYNQLFTQYWVLRAKKTAKNNH